MSSRYEYSSSSTKGGADAGGLFAQADTNRDGVIDRTEFENLIGGSGSGAGGTGGSYGSSSYKSSRVSSSGGVADTGLVGLGGRSLYESSSYSSGVGRKGAGLSGRYQSSSYESTSGFDASEIKQAASYTADTNAAWSRYGAEVRGVGLYFDSNPQIIRREALGGVQTHTQNVRLRFLQPPPVPPSGPLIIKEVRLPQPPAPPPLRIRQQEPPVPQLPPLYLRERPPQPPAPMPAETVVRHLPALPVPPRSVIIERFPAAPASPRDIIIERWIPYGTAAERKTIVERAEVAEGYDAPHNVIIEYNLVPVRVVRQFQQLGISQENPQAYLARYGAELLDTQTLLQQARAAGVVEDISVPAAVASSFSSLSYSSDASFNTGNEASLVGGTRLYGVVDRDLGGTSSSYSSSAYEGSSVGGAGVLVGTGLEGGSVVGVGLAEGGGNGFSSSSYKSSSSYSSSGGVGFDVTSTGFDNVEAKL